MIIFNFYAIAIGLIIAVVVGPIYWLMPDEFANSPLGLIILASIGTLLAGISEAGGLKGRLFFLPMWLIGIIGTLVYTLKEYSWKGIGILALVLVFVAVALVLFAYFLEKSEWRDAFKNFMELKKMNNTEEKAFWEQVNSSKFIPSIMNYTNGMCEHNLEVIAYMKFVGIEWEEIEALIPVFQDGSIKGNEIEVNTELTEAFEARLIEVLEGFEEEEDE
ncbi:MAG: hypothetical protein ACJAVH_002106 [Bacteroidia bacterium]|jgi:hypothetical protein